MAYVNVPKDLTKVKTKVALGLTKRQLICFSSAAAVGVPIYFLTKGAVGGTVALAIPEYPGAPMDDARFATMMEEAQKHLGKRYVFGASGPDTFDCSGFVSYVLNHSIYPGFRRTNAQGLYNLCTPVSRADAQPGDLIFFTGTYNAGRPVTHVGIYIGNGQMIHSGKPCQYASIWPTGANSRRSIAGRRISRTNTGSFRLRCLKSRERPCRRINPPRRNRSWPKSAKHGRRRRTPPRRARRSAACIKNLTSRRCEHGRRQIRRRGL